jgi:hypothetical protein
MEFTEPVAADARLTWIDSIAAAPTKLRGAVAGLDEAKLDRPYRPGGWSSRQVVHHVVDSHMNAYIRSKLLLTENQPTIKPYLEAAWAGLPDSNRPIGGSLALLDHLHDRWVALLRALPDDAFDRMFYHPEYQASYSLNRLVATYAWHGAHHTAHITELRRREGW